MANAFQTSVVGSLPRPQLLIDAFAGHTRSLGLQIDRITALNLERQHEVGLDVITDGEASRNSFVSFVGQRIPGFEVSHIRELMPEYKAILNELKTQLTYSQAIVTEKLVPTDFVTADVERIRRFYDGPLKFTLPGPYLVMWECWHPEKSKAAYPDPEDFAADFAVIEEANMQRLKELGVDFIQIDEPMAGDLTEADDKPDRYHEAFTRIYGQKYRGFKEEKELAFRLVKLLTSGMEGHRVGMHMDRWPNPDAPHAGEGYERLFPEILVSGVTQLVLEYSNPICGDPTKLLSLWPGEIGLGCVNVRMEREEDLMVETPEIIANRVEPLVDAGMDPSRIWLNPDCGFAPGMYREYPRDTAFAKLRSMVKAAELLRETYPG